jgi:uncharacterized protein
MVIAVFKSLEGESLEDYSIRLAQRWRIGQKGLDNGLILLVFLEERKVRVEVGYGLEPTITDVVASQIIRQQIAPHFRERRYGAGLEAAVRAVFARIEATASPAPARPTGPNLPLVGFVAILAVIAVILLQEVFGSRRFLQRNGYTAGRGGWVPPVVVMPPWRGGWGGRSGGGGGGFSGGGGGFGGGGASGDW